MQARTKLGRLLGAALPKALSVCREVLQVQPLWPLCPRVPGGAGPLLQVQPDGSYCQGLHQGDRCRCVGFHLCSDVSLRSLVVNAAVLIWLVCF